MQTKRSKSTVYFDGSCPLCRVEIAHYRGADRGAALCFVDVSEKETVLPNDLSRQQAMERFHVRGADGQILSGAKAFVEVWSRLPGWRWAANATALPGAIAALELGYRLFLPVRPFISRLFSSLQRRLGHIDPERRI